MISAHQQYLTSFDAILDSCYNPISDVKPADWYEEHMYMPEGSAFPGFFNYNKTPYWREPVNRFDKNDPAKTVTIMGGAQAGKTAAVIMPLIAYSMKNNPGHILYLTGHDELIKAAMDNVDFMLTNTGLHTIVGTQVIRKKNNKSGDTDTVKTFPAGWLRVGTVTNDNLLRQYDCMIVIADDFSAAKTTGKATGSKKVLIEQRQAMFKNKRKTLYVSSPQIKGNDNIEHAYLLGDQRQWNIPCPCCHRHIVLEWVTPVIGSDGLPDAKDKAGIYYEVNEVNQVIPSTVGYICQRCGGFFNETNKYEWNMNGLWVPSVNPAEDQHYSYYLSSLNAPAGAYDWLKYCQVHANAAKAEAEGKAAEMQSFTNIVLGLPYEPKGESPTANQLQDNNIRNYPIGVIPEKQSFDDGNGRIVLVVLSADCNGTVYKENKFADDARIDYEIIAFAETGASYHITHGSIGTFIPREGQLTNKPDREKFTYQHKKPNSVWPLLQNIINTKLPTDSGRELPINIAGIDSGHFTSLVYDFVENYQCRALLYALKGKDQDKYIRLQADTPTFQHGKEKPYLMLVNVNQVKDMLAAQINLQWRHRIDAQQPAGFINFPQPGHGQYMRATYFKHYEAEQRQLDPTGKIPGFCWQKKDTTVQNHFWDVRVYAIALCDIFVDYIGRLAGNNKATWKDYVEIFTQTHK